MTFQQVQKYENGTNRISLLAATVLSRELDCDIREFIPSYSRIDTPALVMSDCAIRLALDFDTLAEHHQRGVKRLVAELC